jgi:hypothetical protein
VVLLLGQVGHRPVKVVTSFGSQNLSAAGAELTARISTVLALAGMALVGLRVARALSHSAAASAKPGSTADAEVFVAGVAATLTMAMAFSKVLSPQYLVWLPTVLVLGGGRGRAAFWVAVTLLGATQLYLPARYPGLRALQPGPVALLVTRNGLLLVLTVCCWLAIRSPGPRGRDDRVVGRSRAVDPGLGPVTGDDSQQVPSSFSVGSQNRRPG